MRLIKLIALLLLLVFVALPARAYYSPGQPNKINLIYDFAHMMSDGARTQLDAKLVQFEKDTSNQISVVTIDSLKGDTIENFSVKLFEEWGIGKKDKDNGVLLLIASQDHQMRIEVGYGLEGALTDAQSYWIIQNILRPAFQAGNYDQGISDAIDKIIAATKGEYVPSENSTTTSKINVKSIVNLLFFLFLIPIWFSSILARSKSWWAGGVIGAIIGFVFIFIFSWLIGLIAMAIFTPLGLLFDYSISKHYRVRKATGKHPSWWAGGPWFGGFGGFGGGSGGGGFGGFSGGSSGGGGSSGSW